MRAPFRCAQRVLLSLAMALTITQAEAASSSAAQVVYLNVGGAGFRFELSGVLTGCSDASGTQFYVDWSLPTAKQIYALVLSAYQTGDYVAASYSCEAASGAGMAYVDGADVRK